MQINLDSDTYSTYKNVFRKFQKILSDESFFFEIMILFYYELSYKVWDNQMKNLQGDPMRTDADYLRKFAKIFLNKIKEKLRRIEILGYEDNLYYKIPITIESKYFKMLTDLSIELMDRMDFSFGELRDVFSPLNKNMLSEIISAMILCLNNNFSNIIYQDFLRFSALLLIEKLDVLFPKKSEKKAKIMSDESSKKIVSFRGAQIMQFEAIVLQELEALIHKQFTLVNKVEWNTKIGFSVQNKRISGIGLYIEGENLTSLPDSIGQLNSLIYLYSDVNELVVLPESIGNLKSLQDLRLEEGHLVTLPKSMGNLKSLQILVLDVNKLTTLPESIGNLSSLQVLILGYNKLTTLPESIGNLSSLQELEVDNNQLHNLPKSISNLQSLKKLDLHNNQLSTLPKSMINMTSLTALHISGNLLDPKGKFVVQQLKKNRVAVS